MGESAANRQASLAEARTDPPEHHRTRTQSTNRGTARKHYIEFQKLSLLLHTDAWQQLRFFSPRANYTDGTTAACRRS
jgi:hypothetical protein